MGLHSEEKKKALFISRKLSILRKILQEAVSQAEHPIRDPIPTLNSILPLFNFSLSSHSSTSIIHGVFELQ